MNRTEKISHQFDEDMTLAIGGMRIAIRRLQAAADSTVSADARCDIEHAICQAEDAVIHAEAVAGYAPGAGFDYMKEANAR